MPAPQTSPTATTARRGKLGVLLGPMPRYILRRLGQSLFTVFLTLTTVFVLIRMAPGDPAYSLAGPLTTTDHFKPRPIAARTASRHVLAGSRPHAVVTNMATGVPSLLRRE